MPKPEQHQQPHMAQAAHGFGSRGLLSLTLQMAVSANQLQKGELVPINVLLEQAIALVNEQELSSNL